MVERARLSFNRLLHLPLFHYPCSPPSHTIDRTYYSKSAKSSFASGFVFTSGDCLTADSGVLRPICAAISPTPPSSLPTRRTAVGEFDFGDSGLGSIAIGTAAAALGKVH